MSEKICETILRLAESGGGTALWLYGIYVFGSVLKFIIGFGCVGFGVCKLCKTIKYAVDERKKDG